MAISILQRKWPMWGPKDIRLLHVLVELLLGTLEDGKGTGDDVFDLGRAVEEVLEEHPYVIVGDAALDHLDAEIGLVASLESQLTVVFRNIKDARQC